MGYCDNWHKDIAKENLTGYMRILCLQSKGETLRNWPAAQTALKRRYKKLSWHYWPRAIEGSYLNWVPVLTLNALPFEDFSLFFLEGHLLTPLVFLSSNTPRYGAICACLGIPCRVGLNHNSICLSFFLFQFLPVSRIKFLLNKISILRLTIASYR